MEHQERLKAALADRYAIEREIGSGGMATVYLAQDLKHDRKVAVKVLKPELAAVVGTERFLAEIRTTANLSHPHILPLHDSGEADGFLFYVMPYVEGDTLRERLDRDGQLPVEEAVRISGHVAEALDYAHRQGVIHRDIKPGNILFQAGDPVVTDFGIALAISSAGEGRLTETGLSLGTPYYMSPEQAAGDQTPNAASDVYSLGCVLYETLTGDPPHTGSSAQAILGKILLGEVTRPTKLRRTIPANVEGTLLKALERLPADRFESVAELAAALKDKAFRHGVGAAAIPGPWKGLAAAATLASLLLLVALAVIILAPDPPPPILRQQIHPPGEGALPNWDRYFALAPDGSRYVYRDTAGPGDEWRLWVKERASDERRPLSGTEGAEDVVFSPDGQWIAYKVGDDLFKRPLEGGGPSPLLQGVDGRGIGLSWMPDGNLLTEREGGILVRISEGGDAAPDTIYDFQTDNLIWIQGLPGSEAFLVVTCPIYCNRQSSLYVFDSRDGTPSFLRGDVLKAWYIPEQALVWVRRDGSVLAAPFDLDALELQGPGVPLLAGVRTNLGDLMAVADFEISNDGTVVLIQGTSASEEYEPVWVDRQGRETPIGIDFPGSVNFPALSPDGTQVVASVNVGGETDLWIADLARGSRSQLTFNRGNRPSWTPDGRSVTYYTSGDSTRLGPNLDLWIVRADGSGEAELLLDYDRGIAEAVWHPSGDAIVFRTDRSQAGAGDLLVWDVIGDTEPEPLVATEFEEFNPTFSPNGRFLAYTSGEEGERQVYVRPFPEINQWRKPVSLQVGSPPVWARDSGELFYRKGFQGDLVAVEMETGDSLQVGQETALFPAGEYAFSGTHVEWDVTSDGQRFFMLRPREPSESVPDPRMIMILGWFEELRDKMGR